ncbi:MAG: CHAD domain-containing protein, partial [Novosphingobium sp.]|nr:CHAD domain-containing protein [Novosphingobium sp.]
VSCARDPHVMLERFDGLLRHDDHGESAGAMVELRSYLASLAHQADAADLDGAMAVVRHRMVEARKRASCWHIEKDGWPALAKGLGSCLRQARKAALTAEAHPDMESFHELRKRIKDHWYHCRLLVALWPEAMAVRSKAAGELGELLGEHHDLAVLVQRLMAGCGAWGDKFRVKQVVALAEARARKLEKQAWPMIERLLAQKPAQLKAHWGRLWRAWREEGSLRERLTG